MIYLDHHAATPLVPAARAAMQRAREAHGNPASAHRAGREARRHLEEGRASVAAAVGASPADVVLTSGGTEACNLGVFGLAAGIRNIVTTSVEHPAVARSVERLEGEGATVERLPTPGGLSPELAAVASMVGTDTLVVVQWVNHETGSVFDVAAISSWARERGARVFVDACQALGKLPVDVSRLGADAVAFVSAKMGGPAGAGALWARRGVELLAVLAGGEQERGRRPGSPDHVVHAGFGAACRELPGRLASMAAVGRRRDRLEQQLVGLGAEVNGAEGIRVATCTNVSVPGWRGEILAAALDVEGVCASAGAACSSGVAAPSPVVRAMHADPWRAEATLRTSLGPASSDVDIERALEVVEMVLRRGSRT